MFPTLIKSFPLIVDGIAAAVGTAAGTVTDTVSGTRTGPISLPDTVPNTREGLRRRNSSIQLAPLTRGRVGEIKNNAMIQDTIETKNRLEDLSRLSDDSLADHLSELIDAYEYDVSEMEDVPLILENIPTNRLRDRQRLLRRAVLATTLIGTPIAGGTSIGFGLMGQNRNTPKQPPPEIAEVDDCPYGEGSGTGPGGLNLSMNGVNRCNIRQIFLNVFIQYSYLIHKGI